jgi:hypothetical protein
MPLDLYILLEGWRGRELAYREALRLFTDAGLAPRYTRIA